MTTSDESSVRVGDLVAGLEPGELVEVQRVAPFGDRFLVEGIGVTTRRQTRRPLTSAQLAALSRIRGASRTFDGDAERFLLGAEAERIRIAHQFDPLFAVNASVVDALPHQIEAVYRYLLPLPRIRFLLADDTGAGKTIMTGLLIKELLFRGVIQKVLVITPGGLTKQWAEEELLAKFNLQAPIVNRASFEADPAQFSRPDGAVFVTSVDFLARNEACLRAASRVPWDLIVVDEAHKLSAYEYGAKVEESARYKAVKELARHADHLVFLTATPHRGRKDTFRRLLLLLDGDLFRKDEHVSDRVRDESARYGDPEAGDRSVAGARNRFFLRRLKEEMVDWDGSPLFTARHTKTVGYDLTPEEKQLYDEVTRYVRSRRREARARKNRNVELTLLVMQRRLASSLFAITRTLENRLAALNEVLEVLRDPKSSPSERRRLLGVGGDDSGPQDMDEYEELSEDEREDVERRVFRQVLTADPDRVEQERDEVAALCGLAEALRDHNEAKFIELLRVLDSSDVIRSDQEKLVVFTEHRDTLRSLQDRLTQRGYRVATIHGGMDVDARRQAQREFRARAKIMVATDAAGEGINLQFCRYLINWDIPWNPNRLEQRMGRVHRYGQQGEVWVYNLVAQNTREGAVLQRVLAKLDVMREQMGDDRVYDVIDEWLEGVPLVALMESAVDAESLAEELARTEEALRQATDERAADLVALQKSSSLCSRLDLRSARELRDASDERRLQPLFIQRFFERAWKLAGGSVSRDERFPVWWVGPTPGHVLAGARAAKMSVPEHLEEPIVFDKQLVSVASKIRVPERTRLIGPGHPLFDALVDWAITEARQAFAKGTILMDAALKVPQRLWLVRSIVQDGRADARRRVAHEQLAAVILDRLGLRSTSPAYLLDCVTPDQPPVGVDLPDRTDQEIQVWTFGEVTEKELRRVNAERQEECDLRRTYLESAFTDLILELEEELNDADQASLFGEQNAEERARLHERIVELTARKSERLEELGAMLHLSADLPQVLTQALVVPAPSAGVDDGEEAVSGAPMRRDDEVEAVAMEVAMRYERSCARTPSDVSKDGEHYDIRSESADGETRFIEVKGRARSGAIMLTGPELDKLRQLGARAWLYVITFCAGEQPRLRVIQDPVPRLDPRVLYRQVQYLVQENDWLAQGEEVPIHP